MPTYEYECTSCHRTFEVRQRISEPALSTCDACGGPVRRLLSPAPFILKGGGWYVTDYPSESRKKAMDAEKSPTPTGSSSTSDKSSSNKSDKSDGAATTPKTDGASSSASTTGASSNASTPKSSD